MRFSSLMTLIVITVTLLLTPRAADAKHGYVANVHPLTNYLHRCLGIGWSDGYHAAGGWTAPAHSHRNSYTPSTPHVYQSYLRQSVPNRSSARAYPTGPTYGTPLMYQGPSNNAPYNSSYNSPVNRPVNSAAHSTRQR